MMTRWQKVRCCAVGLFVILFFAGLSARVLYLQLGDHSDIKAEYDKRKQFTKTLSGMRGRILDRNGYVLALDVKKKHIGVDPVYIRKSGPTNTTAVITSLTRHLHIEPARIGGWLSQENKRFQYVSKYVDSRQAARLEQTLRTNNVRGVVVSEVNTRDYPHGSLMSHVIGYANREGVGSAGIEQRFNSSLKPLDGLRVSIKDGKRREMASRRSLNLEARDGGDIVITLDQFVQHAVELSLERAMKEYNADGAWAVVLESKSGRVLAMASKPDYDLNTYFRSDAEERRNLALSAVYEPGSIMKPIVFAAVLNEGKVNPNEIIDTEYGTWYYRGRPIRDYHGYKELTAADVLKKSSNIGTAKIGLRLPREVFYGYMRNFGFGDRTGVDLPGEEAGIFHKPSRWDGLTQSRVSYGHSISVTALQMVTAINAIANEGRVVYPYVLEEVRDRNGNVIRKPEGPRLGPQAVRPDVARRVRSLMARITEKGGTGRRAAVKGYSVAGKTGTAEKIVNGRYVHDENVASFVGFLPAENPVVTILVSIDHPKGEKRTGGTVAAPVFKDIAEHVIRYLAIPPEGF